MKLLVFNQILQDSQWFTLVAPRWNFLCCIIACRKIFQKDRTFKGHALKIFKNFSGTNEILQKVSLSLHIEILAKILRQQSKSSKNFLTWNIHRIFGILLVKRRTKNCCCKNFSCKDAFCKMNSICSFEIIGCVACFRQRGRKFHATWNC